MTRSQALFMAAAVAVLPRYARSAPVDPVAVESAPDVATPPPTETPPAPPENPEAAPPQPLITEVPAEGDVDAQAQAASSGQWVYTQQYGWVWIPYGDAYTDVPASGSGEPYEYVYYPAYGWCWVDAPWVWGIGPWPFFGGFGPAHFGWYRHGWWRSPWRWHYYGPAPAHGAVAVHGIRTAPWHGSFAYRGLRPAPFRGGFAPRVGMAPFRGGFAARGAPSAHFGGHASFAGHVGGGGGHGGRR